MSGSVSQEAIAFTMPSNNSVSLLSVPGNVTGTCPNMQFGIEASSGGFPSGTFLCSSAVTAFTNTAQGWETLSVSPFPTLTAGVTYHIVMLYPGTGGTAGNNWTFDSGNSAFDLIIPFIQIIDPAITLENNRPT